MLRLKKTLKKVAVTGGLSCGKTSVCRFFQELGAYVISADEIVHQLLSNNQEIIQKVIKLLGKDILVENQIDRLKVANKVFNQPLLLKSLEEILHPAVQEEINKHYELKNNEGLVSLFIAEIPLLFESKSHFEFDSVIVVTADENLSKKWFKEKTGYSDDAFKMRQEKQLSNQEKSKKADYLIINHGTLSDLKQRVQELYQELTKSSKL